MKFKIFLVLFFVTCCLSYSFADKKSIFYVSDNIHMSEKFDNQYVNKLKSFLEDKYGKDSIDIIKFSRFDINTTESFELINSSIKQTVPNAVILMIGEANYYNIYGFSNFMSGNKKIISNKQETKDLFEINKEMASIYGKNTKFINNIFNVAYKQLINTQDKYNPKVIPDFYALEDSFKVDNNLISVIESYKYSWELMKDNEFDKAREFLNHVIKDKKSISMFYYAMASTYLLEQKENNELEALKWLENGILVDPLNTDNLCYKGLILLFMMYKGEVTTEILYFAKMLDFCNKNISNEITTIVMLNSSEYDKKIEAINSWILYDIGRIKDFCKKHNIPLIYASYPESNKIKDTIETYINNNKDIYYINNDINNKEGIDLLIIYRLAENMSNFLINNRILN